jgi:hypothetical protein
MPGKLLDPKLAVERAFAISPHARSSDLAFMIPSATGLVPLTHYVFVGGLKHCLRAIAVDASLYSGHSFRRGGATYAHRLGVYPTLIKRMGDWRSDHAYMLYIDHHTPEGLVYLSAAMTQSYLRSTWLDGSWQWGRACIWVGFSADIAIAQSLA